MADAAPAAAPSAATDATPEVTESDVLLARRIISAARRRDPGALAILLKEGSANVRDPVEGVVPLHAAIEGPAASSPASGGGDAERGDEEDKVLRTVEVLLRNGAIWNDLNGADETPGCAAARRGWARVYECMVEAGVRAELLLRRMDALGIGLGGGDSDSEEEEMEEVVVVEEDGPTAAEARDEHKGANGATAPDTEDVSLSNAAYLSSPLRFRPGLLLDASSNAVMMSWETAIMRRHAATLLPAPGLRVMNVGHGMGIVDAAIQDRAPAEHHVVEAHPQVLARMREGGWFERPGVRVHAGRWQDVLPRLAAEGVVLDAVYYDTFAEDYGALREFFAEWVVRLLERGNGRFGWYNGLGADRQVCYDVYTRIAEMDLREAGFDTEWEDVRVPEDLHGSSQWEGTRRPYWAIDVYRLPVNTFAK